MLGSQAVSQQPACADARTDGILLLILAYMLLSLPCNLRVTFTIMFWKLNLCIGDAGMRVVCGALWASFP